MFRIVLLSVFLLVIFVGPAALAVFGAQRDTGTSYGRHSTLIYCLENPYADRQRCR